MKDRLKILDIWVDPVTRETALSRAEGFIRNGQRPHCVFASNPIKNFSVPADPDNLKVFSEADLLIPDGIGMVWAAKVLYGKHLERIPGSEFIFDLCQLAMRECCSVFFYGAEEEVNWRSVEILAKRYPGLKIAGRANGYIKDPEMPDLIQKINESGAKILFISLGSPKQEKWYATHREALTHIRIVQGIGGTLDTIAGKVKRAPDVWCKLNLEWLYRLIHEPRRIAQQKVLPLFVIKVLVAKVELLFRVRAK